MGVVLGFFLIGIVVLVLFDGLLHRAMEEPMEHHPVSSLPDTPDTNETAGEARTEIHDRL